MTLLSDGVPGSGGTVEQVNVVLPVVDALTQDVDDATVADLALEACQELAPGGGVGVE